MNIPWASVVASDQRVAVDSSGARIGGSKEFDWILTPKIAGELDVPPLRYAYFNPATRRYEVAQSAPASVHVLAGALAAVDTGHVEPTLPLRTVYGGPTGVPWSSHPMFWLVLALAPLPALRARWRGRRRAPGRRVLSPVARMIEASRAEPQGADGRAVRHTYVSVLGERLGLDAEALSTPGALRHALRRAGVTVDTAHEAEALLRNLDVAAFSAHGVAAPRRGRRGRRAHPAHRCRGAAPP